MNSVCVVGAGFSGLLVMHQLRSAGFKVTCLEKAASIGGTWFWSRYPGARVDSNYPIYQYSDKELWGEYNWKERFPSFLEIQDYFAFVDRKWQLSKDIQFNTKVTGATFDEEQNRWTIRCEDGKQVSARWLVAAVGFAAKPYTPSFPGLDKFIANSANQCLHTNDWPRDDSVKIENRRVGVIGTGSSGVQVIQEIGPRVKHLTVFQRTPAQTFPMRQRLLSVSEQDEQRLSGAYEYTMAMLRETSGGFDIRRSTTASCTISEEQRRAHWERLWEAGGLAFVTGAFSDLGKTREANAAAYAFLAEKNRARITDPKKRDMLVPLKQAHILGGKRAALEETYLEVLNQDNVDIIDVSHSGSPILEVTETGVTTKDGHVALDTLVLATGFDAVTGSMTQLDIRGTNGQSLAQKWGEGAATYLGISVHGHPNMFFTYGLHAPTAFSNAPVCIEVQSEWIRQVMVDCREAGVARFEATGDAEREWTNTVNSSWRRAMISETKSWWQGSNIPGKREEPLNYIGGIPSYIAALKSSRDGGYKGFTQVKENDTGETPIQKL